MDKFKEAKLHIDLVEAAYDAVLEAAFREARYNTTEYMDDSYQDDQGWRDSEYVKQHLNAQGKQLLKQAQELADQIEGLL